ncbi:MAG: hypothetical protein A3J07_02255 [Candidatus Doudnabacteria bacterium RIFCSPLOWO2_02_FULL_49_13]|uniref:Four helix bundle protein n=1 Tax=Candidatus Doudnabacteria bacterium RIFCSPHIGHO2_12_FULL_48_16 TaxID=1817838 RepID=A0A1F5PLS3_9BACT|nr:MAG: hypothetical protein A3B77_00460 [Candidatus Doudnabacteria bacterium RIFCSPHIGHO2_02_FULL_49_24]OGE89217.1 MAG: hypothetical protein A2760_02725 [Candidatus Doudnabacteria bacterium RIFCSPHIGHO2_01_FULL_50_67]OGE90754.1 MAG: hypothetical protein A3E29_01355 [Candidatus Doudnabacteria bacterium RIFCSPHIGHO2_12_FULL_48_16]OGE97665.1 MAG: hypothetical protein A2990_02605 [Candidatus Doudnabacteria bacterium RIFCSPLOWO2_01_FULL_49_40]OGF02617.1 MAG: hypothetical protein A3J07_02255 [Candid
MPENKITTFQDLDAWKQGHKLVLLVYAITKSFPKEEVFALVSQMRRCAVSITSNLAEGFSRASFRDKAYFYSMALGSLTELQNQLLISKDLVYLSNDKFAEPYEQSVRVHKIINGLIKSTKERVRNS